MSIQELLMIMENRLINLVETRKQAVASGLIDQVTLLDADISTTNNSIALLKAAILAST